MKACAGLIQLLFIPCIHSFIHGKAELTIFFNTPLYDWKIYSKRVGQKKMCAVKKRLYLRMNEMESTYPAQHFTLMLVGINVDDCELLSDPKRVRSKHVMGAYKTLRRVWKHWILFMRLKCVIDQHFVANSFYQHLCFMYIQFFFFRKFCTYN